MRDRFNIEYELNRFMTMDIGENNDGSFHFAGVDIKPGETYIDAVCRTTPARQRALMGLALKTISLRLRKNNGESVDGEESKVIKESGRLRNMTDEEYDKEIAERNKGNK